MGWVYFLWDLIRTILNVIDINPILRRHASWIAKQVDDLRRQANYLWINFRGRLYNLLGWSAINQRFFMDAIRVGNLDEIMALVNTYPELLERSINGSTPLHEAAYYGRDWAVELVLQLGSPSINCLNTYGRTPLHLAAIRGHLPTIKQLLRHGGRVDQLDDRKILFQLAWNKI